MAATQPAIATVQIAEQVAGVETDLCILEFSDRYFVIVTQLNKLGTMISAHQEKGPDGVHVYAVNTLMVRPHTSWTCSLGPRMLALQCQCNLDAAAQCIYHGLF